MKYPEYKTETHTHNSEITTYSLLLYATLDNEFSEFLLLESNNVDPQRILGQTIIPPSTLLILPRDRRQAVTRYHWLAKTHPLEASEMLWQWRAHKTKDDPKAIVIGFVVGVVPPVGMGDIKKRKKLNIALETSFATNATKKEISQEASALIAEIILRALGSAGGNIRSLEPEMHEWLHGSREVALYFGSKDMIRNIAKTAYDACAIHAVNEHGIAISPAADLETQHERYGLVPME